MGMSLVGHVTPQAQKSGVNAMEWVFAALFTVLGFLVGRWYERTFAPCKPQPVSTTSLPFYCDQASFEEKVRKEHTRGEPCVLDVR